MGDGGDDDMDDAPFIIDVPKIWVAGDVSCVETDYTEGYIFFFGSFYFFGV